MNLLTQNLLPRLFAIRGGDAQSFRSPIFGKRHAGHAARPSFSILVSHVFTLAILLSFNHTGYAQDTSQADWLFYKEAEGVKAYYRLSQCNTGSVVLIKIVNDTASDKKVIWGVAMKDEGPGPMTMSPYALKAGGEVVSDCAHQSPLDVIVLARAFDVSNLIVNLIIIP